MYLHHLYGYSGCILTFPGELFIGIVAGGGQEKTHPIVFGNVALWAGQADPNACYKAAQIQQLNFPRVTSIGSLPPKTLGKSRVPPQSPRRDPAEPSETPAEPSERQISSESLAEGCAPRMVTLQNFRSKDFRIFASAGASRHKEFGSGVAQPPQSQNRATFRALCSRARVHNLNSPTLFQEKPSE